MSIEETGFDPMSLEEDARTVEEREAREEVDSENRRRLLVDLQNLGLPERDAEGVDYWIRKVKENEIDEKHGSVSGDIGPAKEIRDIFDRHQIKIPSEVDEICKKLEEYSDARVQNFVEANVSELEEWLNSLEWNADINYVSAGCNVHFKNLDILGQRRKDFGLKLKAVFEKHQAAATYWTELAHRIFENRKEVDEVRKEARRALEEARKIQMHQMKTGEKRLMLIMR